MAGIKIKSLLVIFLFLFFFAFSGEISALTQSDCLGQSADLVLYNGVCVPEGIFLGLTDDKTPFEILKTFLNWSLSIAGFVAIIAFVISGIQYLVSAGNDDIIKTAKENMMYSIVGVIVMLSGLIIINAIDRWFSGPTVF